MSSVSVILTTFNRKVAIVKAINSILMQSDQPAEVIVIDDGSTDGTESEIRKRFSRIRYHWQDNSGISAARNQGIALARQKWIAFLDSDDEWLPGKLERQMSELKKKPQFRICHTNEIWIRNNLRVNPGKKHGKSGGNIYEKCLPLCVISPSSVLIHRSIFNQYGTFDTALPACEDYDLWLRICAHEEVLFINEPLLVKYGGHSDQLSKKYWGMDRFRIVALEKILNDKGLTERQRIATLEVLIEKIGIYITGAIKRKKTEQVEKYEGKLQQYKADLEQFLDMV